MFSYLFNQRGGARCSICGAEGVNKRTHFDKSGKVKAPHKGSKSTVKQAQKCMKGPGYDILDKLTMSVGSSMNDIGMMSDSGNFVKITKKELDQVVLTCKEVMVDMYNPNLVASDEPFHTVVVKSTKNVTVRDILKAFIANNKKFLKALDEHDIPLDSRYYEGLGMKSHNHLTMTSYGS